MCTVDTDAYTYIRVKKCFGNSKKDVCLLLLKLYGPVQYLQMLTKLKTDSVLGRI